MQQEENIKEFGKKLNVTIILDDMLGSRSSKSKCMNGKTKYNIEYLFSVSRHYNINILCLIQDYRFVSRLYVNCDMFFIYPRHVRMMRDKKMFKEEILINYAENYDEIFNEPKQNEFLFLHLTSPKEKIEDLCSISKVNKNILNYSIYNGK